MKELDVPDHRYEQAETSYTSLGDQQELKTMRAVEIKAYYDARAMVKPVRERNRCWILDYADGAQFHVDVVPAVPNTQQQRSLLEARMLDTR